ncbi:MAG: alpha/beta hydrolase family protein [Blastococcus sp.]
MRGARVLRIVAVAVVLAVGGCAPAAPKAAAPTSTASPAVATRVLDLRDAVRGRALPTTLWYPARGDGPFPLVEFSHGFGSSPGAYEELLSGWAAAGFVVAAPTFPLTSADSPKVVADVLHQPADVSFVLTSVLALNTTRGDALEGRIDAAHVAVAGHSAGAVTTIGLLDTCCADRRITAAIVLAGSTRGFGVHLTSPGVPTLFVHGAADTVLPLAEDRAVFDATTAPAAFVTLTHGEHSAPFDDGTDPSFGVVRSVTTDFLRWTLAGDAPALAALRADATRDGTARLTADRLPH